MSRSYNKGFTLAHLNFHLFIYKWWLQGKELKLTMIQTPAVMAYHLWCYIYKTKTAFITFLQI